MPAPVDSKKLPPLDEWHAPWELDDDKNVIENEDEQVIDKARLRRFIHGLLTDKIKLQTKVGELQTERDGLKEQVDAKQREGESEADRLKRELAEAKDKLAKAPEKDLEKLRLEAALEAGLTRDQIRRLDRDLTEYDDILEDARKLKSEFGGAGKPADEDDDEDTNTPRARPRSPRSPGDPDRGSSRTGTSVQDVLDAVPAAGVFG